MKNADCNNKVWLCRDMKFTNNKHFLVLPLDAINTIFIILDGFILYLDGGE